MYYENVLFRDRAKLWSVQLYHDNFSHRESVKAKSKVKSMVKYRDSLKHRERVKERSREVRTRKYHDTSCLSMSLSSKLLPVLGLVGSRRQRSQKILVLLCISF